MLGINGAIVNLSVR